MVNGKIAKASYNVKIGDEIQIADEKFNIIAIEDDTLRVLAQYGVNNSFVQNKYDAVLVQFDTSSGEWELENEKDGITSTSRKLSKS